MPKKYPIRDNNHTLEESSKRFFHSHLPVNWTAHKPEADYGIDVIVDIFEGQFATGLELLVQLKASEKSNERDVEIIDDLKVSTYNFLFDKLQVVLLVKYVRAENQAYWILLKDVPEPNQDNKTLTVSIPRTNVFNDEAWEFIKNHVRVVTDTKLAAMRAQRLQSEIPNDSAMEA